MTPEEEFLNDLMIFIDKRIELLKPEIGDDGYSNTFGQTSNMEFNELLISLNKILKNNKKQNE